MSCAYCVVNTAGQHAVNCPFNKPQPGTGCLPPLEEIAKEAEELLTKAFKPIGEFLKEHNDRIIELESALEEIVKNESLYRERMATLLDGINDEQAAAWREKETYSEKIAQQALAKKHEGG